MATTAYHTASIVPAVITITNFSFHPAYGRTNWLKSPRKKSAILGFVTEMRKPSRNGDPNWFWKTRLGIE
jgi:hypothetical protein